MIKVFGVSIAAGVVGIASGNSHTCAHNSSQMWCWGYGEYGQLGNTNTLSSGTPVAVAGLAGEAADQTRFVFDTGKL